jgi:uncharacterized SAM-binding protein YcdF (DUF218 family)
VRRKSGFLLALVSALLLGFIFRKSLLQAVGDFLIVQDKLEPADVIHVISGPDYRTEYGIQLYQQGYGKQLFFTGGWCTLHNEYHGLRGERLALEQGVKPEAIQIDDSTIKSTYEEALRLKEFIDNSSQPIHSIIVVSDPFHMWRARWTYRKIFGNQMEILMAPVPFEMTPFQRQWWTNFESRQMVKEEYVKIAYYFARYQFSWGLFNEWLASLDRY